MVVFALLGILYLSERGGGWVGNDLLMLQGTWPFALISIYKDPYKSQSSLDLYSYCGNQGINTSNPHAVTTINGVTYHYDDNGNLASSSIGVSNTWNYRNQLTQSNVGSTTTSYAYDAFGNRVKKDTGNDITIYPFSFYETNGSSTKKHIYANGVLVATVVSDTPAPKIHYVYTNHLGSTNVVLGDDGYINQLSDYYPFGEARIEQTYGNTSQDIQYVGTRHDTETDLNLMGARYADTKRGQFISQDPMFWTLPIGLLSDPQQLNSYSYARNNPIAMKDPSGLLTVIVPGTFNDSTDTNPKDWSPTGKASSFINNVSRTFGETAQIFKWSGNNNVDARKSAASGLAEMINNHQFTEGEQLNIVGHSHGGNVGILAGQLIDRKVDNLVTLGTPVRTVYQPNSGNVSNHINVYSRFDGVQKLGETGDPLSVSGTDPRQYSGADNIGVGLRAGIFPRGSHTNLWENKSVWSLVDTRINPTASW